MTSSLPTSRDLDASLARTMLADRHRLRRQWRAMQEAARRGQPFDRNLSRFHDELRNSTARFEQRERDRPAVRYEDDLPILAKREEIAAAIQSHSVVVVCGETGSGKSTQLPKFLLEMGRGVAGSIGHTQPRRIAARTIAARIAAELGKPLGQDVGFKIRFSDATSPRTFVKLMTDGILLAESEGDRFLNQYDTLIIDEAHERSLNIDFLLGYIKQLLPQRPELRLIITSATIDAARFSEHFAGPLGPAPVIEVSGRSYPVEIRYRPLESDEDDDPALLDWQRGLTAAVDELAAEGPGDLLVFMPTERDIRDAARVLRGHQTRGGGQPFEILPLYGRLSTAEQNRVFESHGQPRIVIATNVAESSLTVPRIRGVIDLGTARLSRYSPRSQVQRLPIEPISRASADQRAGRCGRIGPGICIRLYSREDYASREPFTPPEILRTNLASVILQTTALRLGDIEKFPFLEPPRPTAIRDGYRTLFELGAIDERQQLTGIGRQIARLPVDPRIGRMILAGEAENCLNELLIIASALEVQDPRERPIDKQQAADEAHAQFAHKESDFLSYLKLWDFFHELKDKLSKSKLRKACSQNFLSFNRLREWADVHRQLVEIVSGTGLKQKPRHDDYDAIHRALLTGLLANIALRGETAEYTGGGGQKFVLWPGSGLFEAKPKWIVAAELIETTRRYARTAARIQPAWIEQLAGHLIQRTYSEPAWSAERGSVMAIERVSLFGLPVVSGRSVQYGRIDPVVSRDLFIRHALVEGDFDTPAEFFLHNQKLRQEIEGLQAKVRRPDLLVEDDAIYDFYDRQVPPDVCDKVSLQQWLKRSGKADSRRLFMSKSDLLRTDSDTSWQRDFPDTLRLGSMQLPLAYRLEPGTDEDGVTLTVPSQAVHQLDPFRIGWLVPGLLEEKIAALIRSLRKDLRRCFVPASETAREVFRQIRFGEGDLHEQLAALLSRMSGERIAASDFDAEKLPRHLRMNVKVVDEAEQQLASGRDVNSLRRDLATTAADSFAAAGDAEWSRDGIIAWDFGDLPEQVTVRREGLALQGFPTLLDRDETVSLQLADHRERAVAELRRGVRRLFVLSAGRTIRQQVDHLPGFDRWVLNAAALAGFDLRAQLQDLIADLALFQQDRSLPRSEPAFQQRVKLAKGRISLAAQDAGQLMGPLWSAFANVRALLPQLKAPSSQETLHDLQQQLRELLTPDFLTATPWEWLQQFPRYLQAIEWRLKKLPTTGAQRDRERMHEVQLWWRRFDERRKQHAGLGVADPALAELRWMIEEYRVSLFAQELRTVIPVSPQRLEKQLAKVRVEHVR